MTSPHLTPNIPSTPTAPSPHQTLHLELCERKEQYEADISLQFDTREGRRASIVERANKRIKESAVIWLSLFPINGQCNEESERKRLRKKKLKEGRERREMIEREEGGGIEGPNESDHSSRGLSTMENDRPLPKSIPYVRVSFQLFRKRTLTFILRAVCVL